MTRHESIQTQNTHTNGFTCHKKNLDPRLMFAAAEQAEGMH